MQIETDRFIAQHIIMLIGTAWFTAQRSFLQGIYRSGIFSSGQDMI